MDEAKATHQVMSTRQMDDLIVNLLDIVIEGEMKKMDSLKELRQARSFLAKYQANLKTEQKIIFENGVLCGKTQFFVDIHERLALKAEAESCLHDETLMRILRAIEEEGTVSHGRLAQRLRVSPNALSNIFNRHANYYNYIYLALSDRDRRIKFYSLNKRGRHLLLYSAGKAKQAKKHVVFTYVYTGDKDSQGGMIENGKRSDFAFAR